MYKYKTHGTCSQEITFELKDGLLHNVSFLGGCHGNTQGIGKLVEGMSADDVVARLKGIRCGYKDTSCPDQLARAVEIALKKQAEKKEASADSEKA